MAKEPARELRIFANQQTGTIEIVVLADGSPVTSIAYTQEEAESHARQVIAAIEHVAAGKSRLILPEKVGPTPWH